VRAEPAHDPQNGACAAGSDHAPPGSDEGDDKQRDDVWALPPPAPADNTKDDAAPGISDQVQPEAGQPKANLAELFRAAADDVTDRPAPKPDPRKRRGEKEGDAVGAAAGPRQAAPIWMPIAIMKMIRAAAYDICGSLCFIEQARVRAFSQLHDPDLPFTLFDDNCDDDPIMNDPGIAPDDFPQP